MTSRVTRCVRYALGMARMRMWLLFPDAYASWLAVSSDEDIHWLMLLGRADRAIALIYKCKQVWYNGPMYGGDVRSIYILIQVIYYNGG